MRRFTSILRGTAYLFMTCMIAWALIQNRPLTASWDVAVLMLYVGLNRWADKQISRNR